MKKRYTVAEKAVQDRDGASYNLANYKEGDDYVVRRCFSSSKRMFRSDILGVSVVNPSLVEHKQEPEPVILPEKPEPQFEVEPQKQDERHVIIVPPSRLDDAVKTCKVVRKYPNTRILDTDTQGRIIVGKLGAQLKVGQVIKVKNGTIYTGR